MKKLLLLLIIRQCLLFISECFAQEIIPYRSGEKWGYAKDNGQLIVPAELEEANPINNGTASFIKNGKEGIINAKGKIIIEANEFARLEKNERLNIYIVQNELRQTGIIDIEGKNLVPVGKYEYIRSFNKFGLAEIKDGDEEGVIDHSGNEIISLGEYDDFKITDEYILVKKKDNYGLLDKNGAEIIPIKYGYISVLDDSYFKLTKDGKNGIFLNGETIIPLKYDKLNYAKEDLFSFELEDNEGYLNNKGKVIIDKLSNTPYFKDGFAKVKKDGKNGVINSQGKVIIPFGKYDAIKDVKAEVFEVKKDGKVGIVDINGKEVIPPNKYQKIGDFTGGFAIVYNDKFGMVDTEGKEIVPCKYEAIEKIRDEGHLGSLTVQDSTYVPSDVVVAAFYENEKFGLLNNRGNVILPAEYDRFNAAFAQGNLVVMKHYPAHSKYMYGFFDVINEQPLTPVKYKRVESFNTYKYDFPLVYLKDDEASFLSPDGKELINPTDLYTDLEIVNDELILLKGRQVHTVINWKTGATVIDPYEYKSIVLSDNKKTFCVNKQIETQHSSMPKYGFVDLNGKAVTEVKYDKIYGYHLKDFVRNGIIKVRVDGKDGYIDLKGKEFFD